MGNIKDETTSYGGMAMTREKMTEEERLAFNAELERSQREGVSIKIVDGKGYYIFGALGTGMGAWSRAARLAKECGLSELPTSLPKAEWSALVGEVQVVAWPR